MRIRIEPSQLEGSVAVPPSKSLMHRVLICEYLSTGIAPCINDVNISLDIQATRNALQEIAVAHAAIATTSSKHELIIDCKESASTLRFLLPLVGALGLSATFIGTGRLSERPIAPLLEVMMQHGITVEPAQPNNQVAVPKDVALPLRVHGQLEPDVGTKRAQAGDTSIAPKDIALPLRVYGQLQPGTYMLPGNISSQFISGLLMALPLLYGKSTIQLTTPLESAPYAFLTIDVLAQYGIEISEVPSGYEIAGGQRYQMLGVSAEKPLGVSAGKPLDVSEGVSQEATVESPLDVSAGKPLDVSARDTAPARPLEADWSSAAFWLAARAMGARVDVSNLTYASMQGDERASDYLEQIKNNATILALDMRHTPDLLPPLAVAAAFSTGVVTFDKIKRLRTKESDRIKAVVSLCDLIGSQGAEAYDRLTVIGTKGAPFKPFVLEGVTDHRILMAACIAATFALDASEIDGIENIAKSYPSFLDDFISLGGKVHVIDEH